MGDECGAFLLGVGQVYCLVLEQGGQEAVVGTETGVVAFDTTFSTSSVGGRRGRREEGRGMTIYGCSNGGGGGGGSKGGWG